MQQKLQKTELRRVFAVRHCGNCSHFLILAEEDDKGWCAIHKIGWSRQEVSHESHKTYWCPQWERVMGEGG